MCFQSLPTTPLPRLDELAAPHPTPIGSSFDLRIHVVGRIPPVGQRPSVAHHPLADIVPAGSTGIADCDNPPIAIAVPLDTGYPVLGDEERQGVGCLKATLPFAFLIPAFLLGLGGIDPVDADTLAGDSYRVAVDDAGLAGAVGERRT